MIQLRFLADAQPAHHGLEFFDGLQRVTGDDHHGHAGLLGAREDNVIRVKIPG